jgi:hypothetical protein
MTSAYQQQLAQQLHAAEDELGKLRRQVADLADELTATRARAIRSHTAWWSACRRASQLNGKLASAKKTSSRRRVQMLDAETAVDAAEAERDGAYRERAHLTAWLATVHPAVIAPAVDIDEDGWQLLYITVGGCQLSWHIHPRDADLYAHVEHVDPTDPRAQWDGHTTEQKYQAIREMTLTELRGDARAKQAETRIAAATDALNSVHRTMVHDPRDWGLDRRDAWLYALLVGWGHTLDEIAARHRWAPEDVERLRTFRAAIAGIYSLDEPTTVTPEPTDLRSPGRVLAALSESVRIVQDFTAAMQKLTADLHGHRFAVTVTPGVVQTPWGVIVPTPATCGPACSEAHTYDGCCQLGPTANTECPLTSAVCSQRRCTTTPRTPSSVLDAVAPHLATATLPTQPGPQHRCPACTVRGDIPHPYQCPGHPTGRLTEDDTTALLHAHRAHPGWEYATTTGPRKAWDDADVPPDLDDWEPNTFAGTNGWERFDYHEEAYWRRPNTASPTR